MPMTIVELTAIARLAGPERAWDSPCQHVEIENSRRASERNVDLPDGENDWHRPWASSIDYWICASMGYDMRAGHVSRPEGSKD